MEVMSQTYAVTDPLPSAKMPRPGTKKQDINTYTVCTHKLSDLWNHKKAENIQTICYLSNGNLMHRELNLSYLYLVLGGCVKVQEADVKLVS